MMFKTVLTIHMPHINACFLTKRILPEFKVISRSLSDQCIDIVEKWDLLSAVCLERQPIITKPMQDVELKYQKLLQQVQLENSMLSDFEIWQQKEKIQKQQHQVSISQHVTSSETTDDLLRLWDMELAKFKFAPRTSEIDKDKKAVSLKRKLHEHLILLVEQKIGDSNFWIPPQTKWKYRETMIQTARRSLQEHCGSDVKVKFYGKAPVGFYQYKYPKSIQKEGREGAKIFYFLAKYISGNISSNVKYSWLSRDELKAVIPHSVHKSLSKFLLPD